MLSLASSVGIAVTLVRGDDPYSAPAPTSGPVIMGYGPVVGPEAAFVSETDPMFEPSGVPAAQPRAHHPLSNWLQEHPCHCWATHNTVGCSSLKAECTFLFGSCRAFYGEPCLRGASPLDLLRRVGPDDYVQPPERSHPIKDFFRRKFAKDATSE